MCTAISHPGKRHYFGRNLDLEYSYEEQVVVTPRNFPFRFRCGISLTQHYAMIGMATVSADYPLYYEATNERGLSVAALNFPGNAAYLPKSGGKRNLAPFEVIPWILSLCETAEQARKMLQSVNIWHLPFSRAFPLTPMHWMISDQTQSLVAEPMADGLHVYDNPVGVLTNSPPFPYHLLRLSDYMGLHPGEPEQILAPKATHYYSNGMGAIGLPGDFSSVSRFVRASYVKENSVPDSDLSHFFHILNSVAMPQGSVRIQEKYEITRYSSCCDTKSGVYYVNTYNNHRLQAVDLQKCALNNNKLFRYDLTHEEDITILN